MNTMTNIVIRNIYEYAKIRGMKIGYLERNAGFRQGYLTRVRAGDRRLTIDTVYVLADLLDVTVDELCTPMIEGEDVP